VSHGSRCTCQFARASASARPGSRSSTRAKRASSRWWTASRAAVRGEARAQLAGQRPARAPPRWLSAIASRNSSPSSCSYPASSFAASSRGRDRAADPPASPPRVGSSGSSASARARFCSAAARFAGPEQQLSQHRVPPGALARCRRRRAGGQRGEGGPPASAGHRGRCAAHGAHQRRDVGREGVARRERLRVALAHGQHHRARELRLRVVRPPGHQPIEIRQRGLEVVARLLEGRAQEQHVRGRLRLVPPWRQRRPGAAEEPWDPSAGARSRWPASPGAWRPRDRGGRSPARARAAPSHAAPARARGTAPRPPPRRRARAGKGPRPPRPGALPATRRPRSPRGKKHHDEAPRPSGLRLAGMTAPWKPRAAPAVSAASGKVGSAPGAAKPGGRISVAPAPMYVRRPRADRGGQAGPGQARRGQARPGQASRRRPDPERRRPAWWGHALLDSPVDRDLL
jgi:hypothetical protein